MAKWKEEFKLWHVAFDVLQESAQNHAEHIADAAGLEGEERWTLIERVKQVDGAKDVLAMIGIATLAVTPYIVIKAITR